QLAALKTALLWQICPSRQLLALSTQKPVKHFFNYFCRGEQLQKKTWRFPSGNYEFMGLNEPMLGACHICSLISPVVNFTTHKEAVTIAQEIISALFVEIEDKRSGGIEEARLTGKSTGQKEMSRRDFLRIPLMGSQ
ncbi:[NiFe]-hydrogenase assembly chaperone HybE, partial [Ferrovum myxofaciens]|uniref:[NiFe]-hydrogenase assembly chaperone HybE n=1 Tax=Ferrovum myxofaciens TaxID=416213 RepID=UPI0012370AF4